MDPVNVCWKEEYKIETLKTNTAAEGNPTVPNSLRV